MCERIPRVARCGCALEQALAIAAGGGRAAELVLLGTAVLTACAPRVAVSAISVANLDELTRGRGHARRDDDAALASAPEGDAAARLALRKHVEQPGGPGGSVCRAERAGAPVVRRAHTRRVRGCARARRLRHRLLRRACARHARGRARPPPIPALRPPGSPHRRGAAESASRCVSVHVEPVEAIERDAVGAHQHREEHADRLRRRLGRAARCEQLECAVADKLGHGEHTRTRRMAALGQGDAGAAPARAHEGVVARAADQLRVSGGRAVCSSPRTVGHRTLPRLLRLRRARALQSTRNRIRARHLHARARSHVAREARDGRLVEAQHQVVRLVDLVAVPIVEQAARVADERAGAEALDPPHERTRVMLRLHCEAGKGGVELAALALDHLVARVKGRGHPTSAHWRVELGAQLAQLGDRKRRHAAHLLDGPDVRRGERHQGEHEELRGAHCAEGRPCCASLRGDRVPAQ
mmetsp:Transcript_22682/g.58359  ORF Transcript_22682/g.58359 Transcript_22682/m.58359 type:complete len:469 (-) Transcript_22682:433-1839(-)